MTKREANKLAVGVYRLVWKDGDRDLAAVGKKTFQGFAHGSEGDFVPGNFMLGKQPRFDGLETGYEHVAEQARQVKHMDLSHAGHVQQREETFHGKLRARFFQRFARCAFGHGLVHFHEAGGQRPFAKARLDIAFAQQDLVAPVGHGPHHIEWILVVNGAARRTHRALFGVAIVGQPVNHGGAAVFAVFDGRAQHEYSVI